MMNKCNTEGYVLAYVLIVITVMGMIAATLMTSTLQVITAQENSIEYMKDKYAAMGEVEKFLAEFDKNISSTTFSGDNNSNPDAALTAAQNNIPSVAPTGYSGYSFCTISESQNDTEHSGEYTYTINSISNQIKVCSTIVTPFEVSITEKSDADPDSPTYTYSYSVTFSPFSVSTYEITSNGGGT